MREEWNERAREDAHYYVAFGRREQDDEGFFATATEVLNSLDQELKRGTPAPKESRRFLEIGCGPGRLLRPMSERCAEIHGVDVSDEMVARARCNLTGIDHAHAHVGTGSTLENFADESFDFVYSYAVFQHIPSRDVVFSYLREAVRVLKPGGLARLQINGLPKDTTDYTTWSGVRISGAEIREFAQEQGLQLLALEGLHTQYMWTTWRKAPAVAPQDKPSIVRVTNTFTSEPLAPVRGRFASISLWADDLSDGVDLNTLNLNVGGLPATLTYLGRKEYDGWQQINAILPEGLEAGMTLLNLNGAEREFRLLPAPPLVPYVVSLTDGIDLLSENRITSRIAKVVVEEFEPIESFRVELADGTPLEADTFCVNPGPPRHEVNIRFPESVSAGEHQLHLYLNQRRVASLPIAIV